MAGEGPGRSTAWAWMRVAGRRRLGSWVSAPGASGVDVIGGAMKPGIGAGVWSPE